MPELHSGVSQTTRLILSASIRSTPMHAAATMRIPRSWRRGSLLLLAFALVLLLLPVVITALVLDVLSYDAWGVPFLLTTPSDSPAGVPSPLLSKMRSNTPDMRIHSMPRMAPA